MPIARELARERHGSNEYGKYEVFRLLIVGPGSRRSLPGRLAEEAPPRLRLRGSGFPSIKNAIKTVGNGALLGRRVPTSRCLTRFTAQLRRWRRDECPE